MDLCSDYVAALTETRTARVSEPVHPAAGTQSLLFPWAAAGSL